MSVHELQPVISELDALGCEPEQIGNGYAAYCPVHELDGNRHKKSLSIESGRTVPVICYCHAGCSFSELRKVIPALSTVKDRKEVVAVYLNREGNKEEFRKIRFWPKDFRYENHSIPNNDPSKMRWKLPADRDIPEWPLYRLPELIAAKETGETVFYVEGEKDVDRLVKLNCIATTNREGASKGSQKPKWHYDYTKQLTGLNSLVLIPDNDEPGRSHMANIASQMQGKVNEIILLDLGSRFPELKAGGDVSDWLNDGHSVEELIELVSRCEPWQPDNADNASKTAPDAILGDEPAQARESDAPAQPSPESAPPAQPSRFKFKPLSEIIKTHPGTRTYWIRPYIPAASVILIYGDPACGKTTIAADIDCCIATATDWRGMPTKRGKILYVAAEDYYGARLRIEAWFDKNGLSADIDTIEMLDVPVVLADEADVDELIAYVNSMPVKPATITIDTLALSMGKYSENNDMQLFCNGATKIKRQTGITVIVIHHCGHGDKGRSRGGSQLPANADVIYQVERKEDICTMTCQKMKNGVEPPKLSWRMMSQKTIWVDEDRKIITSVVLEPTDAPSREPSKNQQVALEVLANMVHQQKVNLGERGYDPEAARVLMTDWQTALIPAIGAKASRNQARNELIEKGLVAVDGLFVSIVK